MSDVMDLTGRKVAGGELVTIRLHPGVGVTGPNGEHMEGGPHEVPAHFAYPIVRTNRAVVIEGAPAGVEHRDPTPETREGRRRR